MITDRMGVLDLEATGGGGGVWSERGASWKSDPSFATKAADLAGGGRGYTTEEGSSRTGVPAGS